MKRELWNSILNSLPDTRASIIAPEDVEEAADMLDADNINHQKFLSNMEAFFAGPNFKTRAILRGQNIEEDMTSSMKFFAGRIDKKAPAIPIWFYSAYPDVMNWFTEKQKQLISSRDTDFITAENSKLYGINISDPLLNIQNITNSKGETKPKYLKNLVHNFKITFGQKLEAQ